MLQDDSMTCTQAHSDPSLSLDYCGLEHCKSGHRYGPLVRSLFVLHVVISGKGKFVHRGRTWELSGGSMFLLPPGEETLYMADEKDPWYYCWIGFRGELANGILRRIGFTSERPVVTVRETEPLEQGIRALIRYPEMKAEDALMRQGLLYQLFAEMVRLCNRSEGAVGLTEEVSYSAYALTYFRNHFREKIRIAQVAEKIGISRSYLMRIVKEETGVSPQEYLIRLRMTHGVHYLLHTNLDIQEVARNCGYEDGLAFSKAFKSRFGMNPTDFRNIKDDQRIEELLQHFSIQRTLDTM